MTSRTWPWSVAIAVGSSAILALYLTIISRQGSRPLIWVIVMFAFTGSLPLFGLLVPSIRKACLAISATMLTILTVLGVFSIGIFVLPVAVLAWVAFALDSQHSARHALAAAGWYPDPGDQNRHRYWDGTTWTGYVA